MGHPANPETTSATRTPGLLSALSALAALRHRDRTGRGQYIELAMIEGELQLLAGALLDVQMNGRVQSRAGNGDTSMAPHGVYPTRAAASPSGACPRGVRAPHGFNPDAWVAIAVATDAEWRALCDVIGRPDLRDDPRFADVVSRYRNQAEADAAIAAWTVTLDHHEAMRRLQAAGVRAAAALTMRELHEDPHVRARRVLQPRIHPEMGPVPHTRVALKLADAPAAGPQRPAPCFGEHNELVARHLLGYSADVYATLMAAGVMADHPHEIEER
ncbi:MAG: CoA transferase [Dehalococcoidia bacterium]